ncbi:MAG: DNA polymerase III subunit delta' [Gammaproteobacteria bacterium]
MTIDTNPILPWQLRSWRHLCGYRRQQRMPQALLITGREGLGKRQLAEQFAFSLMCAAPKTEGTCCGRCDSCLLIRAGTHPDLIRIGPAESGKSIGIDAIRAVIADTALKPQYEACRVVIIDPADQMNASAANAFLKCLEEPNERTVFLLIADKPAKLPATVISRCQKHALVPPAKEIVSAWLRQQNIVSDLDILISLSQHSPLLALRYAEDGTVSRRNECFKAWLAIAGQKTSPIAVAEDWLKLSHSELLFWLTSWTIDLIKCALPVKTDNFYNPDQLDFLQELAAKLDLKSLYQFYDLLLASRQRLETQINKQLMFEEILLRWSHLNRSR